MWCKDQYLKLGIPLYWFYFDILNVFKLVTVVYTCQALYHLKEHCHRNFAVFSFIRC